MSTPQNLESIKPAVRPSDKLDRREADMHARWIAVMCAAVGCAGADDEVAPYSADKYGECLPATETIRFDAIDATAPSNTPKCDLPGDSWDFGVADCENRSQAYRETDGVCVTQEDRQCVIKKPQPFGYDVSLTRILWRADGTGELMVSLHAGQQQYPYCQSRWTLRAR